MKWFYINSKFITISETKSSLWYNFVLMERKSPHIKWSRKGWVVPRYENCAHFTLITNGNKKRRNGWNVYAYSLLCCALNEQPLLKRIIIPKESYFSNIFLYSSVKRIEYEQIKVLWATWQLKKGRSEGQNCFLTFLNLLWRLCNLYTVWVRLVKSALLVGAAQLYASDDGRFVSE